MIYPMAPAFQLFGKSKKGQRKKSHHTPPHRYKKTSRFFALAHLLTLLVLFFRIILKFVKIKKQREQATTLKKPRHLFVSQSYVT